MFKNFFAQTAMRNFVNNKSQTMQAPNANSKTRPMYSDKIKGCHDNRFESLNLLPNCSTKFIRDDRAFDLGKFSKRDDKAVLN